jgi:type VI secretion system protein ImpF
MPWTSERPEPAMHTSGNASGAAGTFVAAERHRSAGGGLARRAPALLPTLFDRLRDDAPGRASDTSSDHAVSPARLREIIQRDLALLLNTTSAEDHIDRRRYPEAARSTLNFGVPPLAGQDMSQRRWHDIERIVRRAIADYEPRLMPGSVSVRPLAPARAGASGHSLAFEIHALIDARPYPLALLVQSAVDLETSRLRVFDAGMPPVSASSSSSSSVLAPVVPTATTAEATYTQPTHPTQPTRLIQPVR